MREVDPSAQERYEVVWRPLRLGLGSPRLYHAVENGEGSVRVWIGPMRWVREDAEKDLVERMRDGKS